MPAPSGRRRTLVVGVALAAIIPLSAASPVSAQRSTATAQRLTCKLKLEWYPTRVDVGVGAVVTCDAPPSSILVGITLNKPKGGGDSNPCQNTTRCATYSGWVNPSGDQQFCATGYGHHTQGSGSPHYFPPISECRWA